MIAASKSAISPPFSLRKASAVRLVGEGHAALRGHHPRDAGADDPDRFLGVDQPAAAVVGDLQRLDLLAETLSQVDGRAVDAAGADGRAVGIFDEHPRRGELLPVHPAVLAGGDLLDVLLRRAGPGTPTNSTSALTNKAAVPNLRMVILPGCRFPRNRELSTCRQSTPPSRRRARVVPNRCSPSCVRTGAGVARRGGLQRRSGARSMEVRSDRTPQPARERQVFAQNSRQDCARRLDGRWPLCESSPREHA